MIAVDHDARFLISLQNSKMDVTLQWHILLNTLGPVTSHRHCGDRMPGTCPSFTFTATGTHTHSCKRISHGVLEMFLAVTILVVFDVTFRSVIEVQTFRWQLLHTSSMGKMEIEVTGSPKTVVHSYQKHFLLFLRFLLFLLFLFFLLLFILSSVSSSSCCCCSYGMTSQFQAPASSVLLPRMPIRFVWQSLAVL
jgi:hypothetical protein